MIVGRSVMTDENVINTGKTTVKIENGKFLNIKTVYCAVLF